MAIKSCLVVLFTWTLSVGAYAETVVESAYTSVETKNCVVIDSAELHKDPPIDFLEAECAGFAGYRVFVSGGDIRYFV